MNRIAPSAVRPSNRFRIAAALRKLFGGHLSFKNPRYIVGFFSTLFYAEGNHVLA